MSRPLVAHSRIPVGHLILYGWLPSWIKVWVYRTFLGYRIGQHVEIAFGGVVIGEDVELDDRVAIGLFAIVQGRRIRIRRCSSVATLSYVSCENIDIGEDTRIREQVYVGGPQLPDSRFALGSRTIVLQMAYINSTKPVVVGDDSCIGGHCLVFTHGVWLNVLDGYPATYEPVTLGESVWLPWRVLVMPGSTIGDGAVISATSVVADAIPPRTLAAGSPAKVVRAAPDFPRRLTDTDRATIVESIMREFDRYVEYNGVSVRTDGSVRTYGRGRDTWRLWWIQDHQTLGDCHPARDDTVCSEVTLPPTTLQTYRIHGISWLDLSGRTRSQGGTPLTEELAQFLSRYGIRLTRD
jgi:acetyltransferase-like isoleucine patch superfamily enzyme